MGAAAAFAWTRVCRTPAPPTCAASCDLHTRTSIYLPHCTQAKMAMWPLCRSGGVGRQRCVGCECVSVPAREREGGRERGRDKEGQGGGGGGVDCAAPRPVCCRRPVPPTFSSCVGSVAWLAGCLRDACRVHSFATQRADAAARGAGLANCRSRHSAAHALMGEEQILRHSASSATNRFPLLPRSLPARGARTTGCRAGHHRGERE